MAKKKQKSTKTAPQANASVKNKKNRLPYILAAILVGLFAFKGYMVLGSQDVQVTSAPQPLTKLVSSNASAGLRIIGAALVKYKKEQKQYPAKLVDLYPEYINEKGALELSAWKYRTEGTDYFCLERGVEHDGQKYLYRIDPKLQMAKTVMGGGNKTVLANQAAPGSATGDKSAEDAQSRVAEVDLLAAARAISQTELETGPEQLEIQVNEVPESRLKSLEKHPKELRELTEIDGSAIPEGISTISENLRAGSLLIWVNKDESLCFSNVQYAKFDRVKAICTAKAWLSPVVKKEGKKSID
jgi:hypothetical protein